MTSPRRPSVMEHQFSQIPSANIPRSSFNRSHGYKTALNAGILAPIFVDEALPGDTFNVKMTGFARMATPIYPIMDNIYMETFFFAVPKRLLWEHWPNFCGERKPNPGSTIDYTIPQMAAPAGGWTERSLGDYLGIPTHVDITHSSLWHRAYNLIFNEWFRNENLRDALVVDTDDGPDDPADYTIRHRNKRPDYFVSSLPWPQKGDSVDLPLGTFAPVVGIGVADGTPSGSGSINPRVSGGTTQNMTNWDRFDTDTVYLNFTGPGPDDYPDIQADLSNATAATINQLRQAFQIQKLMERDARGGTRYVELIRSHFGVTSPDFRLQRPEYLGGGSSPVSLVPVPQTFPTGVAGEQGGLAAYGTVTLNNHGFTKSFTEHCILLGIVNVRADITYQQGLDRMFSRETRYDYYWPALSTIGEQAILSKEIYADGTAGDDDVFGYTGRFDEYRYKPSRITGVLRSNAGAPLDSWHLSEDFAARPVLNGNFVKDDPPIDRVIAVPSEPHFILDTYFRMRCARPMPMFGVPGLIDHF